MAVIVSLATIPHREQALSNTIASLLSQTLPPDQIAIHVCPYYRRLETQLPKGFLGQWTHHPHVSMRWVEDEGPAAKFLDASKLVTSDDVLILCDDDFEYPQSALETLVRFLKGRQCTAVGFVGRVLTPNLSFNHSFRFFDNPWPGLSEIPVDILMATGMVAIRARDWPTNMSALWHEATTNGPEGLRLTDDIFLNAVLNQHKIRRFVIPGWHLCRRQSVGDTLWEKNFDGRHNDASLRYFRKLLTPLSHPPWAKFYLNPICRGSQFTAFLRKAFDVARG